MSARVQAELRNLQLTRTACGTLLFTVTVSQRLPNDESVVRCVASSGTRTHVRAPQSLCTKAGWVGWFGG